MILILRLFLACAPDLSRNHPMGSVTLVSRLLRHARVDRTRPVPRSAQKGPCCVREEAQNQVSCEIRQDYDYDGCVRTG